MKQDILKTVALMALILATNLYVSADGWSAVCGNFGIYNNGEVQPQISYKELHGRDSDHFSTTNHDNYKSCLDFDSKGENHKRGIYIQIYKYEYKVLPYTKSTVTLNFDLCAGNQSNGQPNTMGVLYKLGVDLDKAKEAELHVRAWELPAESSNIICHAHKNNGEGYVSNTGTASVTFDNSNNPYEKVLTHYFALALSTEFYKNDWGHGYSGVIVKFEKAVHTYPFPGNGTSTSPFQIGSADNLTQFSCMVNSGMNSGLCAKLTADIDMSNRNWMPIGQWTDMNEVAYTGTFDGDGYTISNLQGDHNIYLHDIGLIGRSGKGCVVKRVLLNNVSLNAYFRSAPIVGLASGTTTIENCGVRGNIRLSVKGEGDHTGIDGLANDESEHITMKFCYTSYYGLNLTYPPTRLTNTYYGYDIDEMIPGELCYRLNNNSALRPIWTQTITSMDYPIQDKNRAKEVYKTGDVYHNGKLPFNGSGIKDDPFLIDSEENLAFFCKLANMGYSDICALLTADIDYSAYKSESDMIGTVSCPYKGVFNGNGKSLKIAFSSKENEVGLFRHVNGAVIGNIHLLGSIEGGRITGSLVGMAYGSTTVSHVISDVTVTSNYSGDAACGGLVAGAKSSLCIDHSAFRGRLLGLSAHSCGGFVGWVYENCHADLTNCYFAPEEVTWKSDGVSSTFARDKDTGRTSLKDCFYTRQFGIAQGEMLTTDQMKSGEGCYRLNGSSNDVSIWLQTLGQDTIPTLWNSSRVYRWTSDKYSNAYCKLPGAGTPADPLLIGSATDLEYFRDLVNDTVCKLPSLCARLTADIDMRDRNWSPIGRWTTDDKTKMAYTGVFDGDGYVISDLSGESRVDKGLGLIGYAGKGCHVCNVIINNVHLKNALHCAPIIGYTTDSCTVEYCGVQGIVRMEIYGSYGYRDGLIADENKCVSLKGCYTNFPTLRPNVTVSDETNHNYCNLDTLKTVSGELCYKLNGNDGKNHHWLQSIGTDPYPMQRTGRRVGYKDGKYANIEFTDADNSVFSGKLISSDFKIIHHGGHLYEFIVALGTKDGSGEHPFPNMKLYYKNKGSWVDIATLKSINREKLPFTGDWSGELSIDKGTFINPHTFETQPPVFWIMQGNHTSKKAASLLWRAPKELTDLPIEFKVESISASSVLQMSNTVTKTTAPTGTNTVMVVEPYINTLATNLPGSAASVINSSNTVYSLGIWDATDDEFISTQEITDGTNNINITLPQQECIHNLVALMYAQQVDIIGQKTDTTYVTYGVPFTQRPFHSICRTNVSTRYNESNTIKWAIAYPKDSDIIQDDIFTAYRAYKSDFSDAEALADFRVGQYSATTEGDTLMGWFAYTDSTKEGQSTSVEFNDTLSAFDNWNLDEKAKTVLTSFKYPARYIHYGVERTTATALWNNATKYWKTWKVLLTKVLPMVDTIRVVKTDGWETTHKVELHLTLNNPYPDALVPAESRQAVIDEAKAHGFNGRMFHWDENASIVITRYSRENEWYKDKDQVAETIIIKGSDVKQDSKTGNYHAVATDIQSAPRTHYYYKAQVNNSGSDFPICLNMTTPATTTESEANACFSDKFAKISNFKATRGASTGLVNLSWDADNAESLTYKLKKKVYKVAYDDAGSAEDNSETEDLKTGNGYAQDNKSKAGKIYEYELTRDWRFHDSIFIARATAYGWSGFRQGSISGHVSMPDGTVLPGDVYVTIRLKNPEKLFLKTVISPDGKDEIFTSFSRDGILIEKKVDEEGFYHVDTLPYYGSGIQYEVSARCSGATFTGSTGTSSTTTLTLEDTNHTYDNVDFICRDTRKFSGRILYEGSTVPVRGMEFKVNGKLLMDKNGEAITTDAMGDFSFSVPAFQVCIQACKSGHTMKDGGYVLGGPGKDQQSFTPTEDYAGLLLYDETKVRLVGRVVGGNVEASKPVGFGQSVNNLGDNITLTLQLEGDNTSYIYYNTQDPGQQSEDGLFFQEVLCQRTDGAIDTVTTGITGVTFHSKRIVINADNATGEFCLDLFPAKYKVSQITAKGYSTLYREGEGLQTIDLTNAKDATHYGDADKTTGTTYAAAFNYVYHSDAKVTLTQTEPQSDGWVGDSYITAKTIFGDKSVQTAWKDKDGVHYSFGHPVFQGGEKYTFMARAEEEYHYNNEPTGILSTCPLADDSITITNSLTSGSQTIKGKLNGTGRLSFTIIPSNTTFSFTGEDALFTMSAAVQTNGWSYESTPIEAYVTGYRDMGVSIQAALKSAPRILDIIRDPYGSGSYAYREKGTSYTWSRHYENNEQIDLTFHVSAGISFILDYGVGYMSGTQLDIPLVQFNLNKILKNTISYKDGEFTLTLNDRITTSSDPLDIGAMADIYIGTMSSADIRKSQVFSLMDQATYTSDSAAVRSGALKTVKKGKDSYGNETYLVIGQGISASPGTERAFIYSQKYIIGTLIPELEKQRDRVKRMASDYKDAQEAADANNCLYYYYNSDTLVAVCPKGMTVTDSLYLYNKQIEQWQNLVKDNEKNKYESKSLDRYKSYSISQATIEHTEAASSYYREITVEGPHTLVLSSGTGAGNGYDAGSGKVNTRKNAEGKEYYPAGVKGFGFLFDCSLSHGENHSISNTVNSFVTTIGGSGYCLSTSDNGVIDMDVYRIKDGNSVEANSTFKSAINNYEGGSSTDEYKITNGGGVLMVDSNSCVHNYIFVQRGGSTRNPWSDADSTYYYKPNGNREPLGARTMRIDNPKIYVENPIVNNQPQDEPAVFTIRLANETEINENTKYLNPSTLYLNVDEPSNPYGAKLTIDGQPLRNHMEFYLNPGQSAVKTLEVARGGKPYDYENIKLQFTDNPDLWTLCDEATISVHYQPVSSPVNLSLPADNWLMNTLSQKDDDGKYYIPVQIDGFSTTKYDNFDHIELQYKKQTEGEDQWVNLCSYYADKQLYDNASGTKAMIQTEGKIENIRFYGEKDPIEMKYDLRAVSFCRLGTGYVTRYSKVVSGTKDTRCPEVFGKPSPADGILDFDDVISLPFTEPIAYNYLDETVNFSVQGYTNNSDADHSAYIRFLCSSAQDVSTKVTRETEYHDFTVEMMVKVENAATDKEVRFFTLGNSPTATGNCVVFGYNPSEDHLVANVGGIEYKSVKLSSRGLNLRNVLTHVALTHSAQDSTVKFIVGEEFVPLADDCMWLKCRSKADGRIFIGNGLKGSVADIRVWTKEFSASDLALKLNKSLSAREKNLFAYYPMKEAQGNIVYDVTNGADLYLTDVTWQTPTGYSVRLDKKPLVLTKKAMQKFTRNDSEDYTLAFWFRADAGTDLKRAILFSAGGDNLSEKGMDKMRIGFIDNELRLASEGNTVSFGVTGSTLAASVWHHLAVDVNNSLNTVSLFLDGKMVNETSADMVGGIAGSYVAFGDSVFSGNIDNVTLWSMALPASYIHEGYNTDMTGREPELLVNLDFEQQLRNEQGSLYIGFSPMNNVIVKATGKIAGDTLVSEDVNPDAGRYAPVRAGTGLQNIPFTWTSTDNTLQINLRKADADINHQQLNLVVRNVEDANGNPMKNASMWSVYVNRNVLEWEKSTETLNLQYGSGASVEVNWKNKSGRILSYSIDNEASWLQIDNTFGTMQPLSEASANLTVSDGLTPGSYRTEIYLTDEDNLVSKMILTVNVEAEAPEWKVVSGKDYPSTMQIIAQVKKKTTSGSWAIDMSDEDMVAAFIDTLCLGKAVMSIDETQNTSYVFLNLAGNGSLSQKVITFRLWDASTGKTHILQSGTVRNGSFAANEITFSNDAIFGADTPVEMRTTDSKMQTLQLKEGWNWVSFNVKSAAGTGVSDLFSDCGGFRKSDIIKHPETGGFSIYSGNNKWDSGLDAMTIKPDNVYQIYKQQAGNVSVSGTAFEDDQRVVTLSFNKEKRWAGLAYLLDVTQPVGVALSDMPASSDKAPAGTVVKNHDRFAVARNDGHWFGSLEHMRPGEGYYVVRPDSDIVSFTVRYTNTSAQGAGTKASFTGASALDEDYTSSLASKLDGVSVSSEHSQSMPVIAAFAEGTWQEGDLLVALVNGDVAGVAEAIIDERNNKPYFFLSVNASDNSVVRFVKVRDGSIDGESRNSLSFNGNAVIGTLKSPYLVDFSESTSEGVYDATGIKYPGEEYLQGRRGVYIINGQKTVK